MALPLPSNITNPWELLQYYNSVSDGMFGIALVVIPYIILIAAFSTQSEKPELGILWASMITTIWTGLLWASKLTSGYVFLILGVITIGGVVLTRES